MFDPTAYGPEIAAILALGDNGQRLLPLVQQACTSPQALNLIRAAQLPATIRAGLYFYFSGWNEAHETAQDIHTPEGSYWHAIVHRQEPDSWNSGYWFRQVGQHPIFPALRAQAAAIGFHPGPAWDPQGFIEYCVRAAPGSPAERIALEVQRAEWQLLFDHCAQQAKLTGASAS